MTGKEILALMESRLPDAIQTVFDSGCLMDGLNYLGSTKRYVGSHYTLQKLSEDYDKNPDLFETILGRILYNLSVCRAAKNRIEELEIALREATERIESV